MATKKSESQQPLSTRELSNVLETYIAANQASAALANVVNAARELQRRIDFDHSEEPA
jgi:hypothetical protein